MVLYCAQQLLGLKKKQKPFLHLSLSKAGPFTLGIYICDKALKCKVFQIIRCLIKPLFKNSIQTIFQGDTSWVAQLLNNMNVWMVLYCAQQTFGFEKNKTLESKLKSIGNKLKVNWNQLKVNWNQLKINWFQLKVNWNQLKVNWNQLKVNWNQLKVNWNQLKITWFQLKVNWKSIESKLKSIESKLKSIRSKIEINWT